MKSLADLGGLLSEEDKEKLAAAAAAGGQTGGGKKGYDGKPQKLRVELDSKRRRGKVVTLVSGFQSTPGELEEIAGMLKRSCGAGGQVLDNAIEIQGDHRAAAIEKLKKLGFLIK